MWFWQSDFIEKASNFKFYAIGTSFRKRSYIIGMSRGTFVYGIFEVNEMGFAVMFLIVCGVYISLLMIAAITQYINQKMRMLILVRR